jgi:hypothetical protein
MDTLWYDNLTALMPTCLIQYEHDTPMLTSANRLSKMLQGKGEDLDVYRRKQQKVDFPLFRVARTRTRRAIHTEVLHE